MIHHHLLCPVPGGVGVPPWGCAGPAHWFFHVTGIDTQTSYFYDAVSGAVPCLALLALIAGAIGAFRHWNCHATWWCWRHAKHVLTDPETGESHALCWRHHPGQRHKHWKPHHIEDVWRRHLERQRAVAE